MIVFSKNIEEYVFPHYKSILLLGKEGFAYSTEHKTVVDIYNSITNRITKGYGYKRISTFYFFKKQFPFMYKKSTLVSTRPENILK